jgi:hypothetical protein
MSGIFRHIPGICQPISYTRYTSMSRICLTYSFRVVASLCLRLEYSRYIPRIFFPSHLVICLEYTFIIPLLANQPAAAMRLGCRCCHSTRILGVKGVLYSAPNVAGTHVNARASADAALGGAASIVMSLLHQIPEKYHDHDDVTVHIKLAQCTARKECKFISK